MIKQEILNKFSGIMCNEPGIWSFVMYLKIVMGNGLQ